MKLSAIILLLSTASVVSGICLCFKESKKIFCQYGTDTLSARNGMEAVCRLLATTVIWKPACFPEFSAVFPSVNKEHRCLKKKDEVGSIKTTTTTTTMKSSSSSSLLSTTTTTAAASEVIVSVSTTTHHQQVNSEEGGREKTQEELLITTEGRREPSSSTTTQRQTTTSTSLSVVQEKERTDAPTLPPSPRRRQPSSTTPVTKTTTTAGIRVLKPIGTHHGGFQVVSPWSGAGGVIPQEGGGQGWKSQEFHHPETVPAHPVASKSPAPTGVLFFELTTYEIASTTTVKGNISEATSQRNSWWQSAQQYLPFILGALGGVVLLVAVSVAGFFLTKRLCRRRTLNKLTRLKDGEALALEYFDEFAEDLQLPSASGKMQIYQLQPLPTRRSPSPSPSPPQSSLATCDVDLEESDSSVYNSTTIATCSTKVF